ncbi:MAG: flagellar hook-basal body complex protein, partial [Oscillospiraceae bacterium]
MVRSMFSGVAGLRAHQTKMDVIGNNIATVNTNGFKTGRVTFKDSFYQTLTGSSASGGSFGGGNASQIGFGSQVNSIDVLHTPGGFAPTGDPSDTMINGNGYYMVGPSEPGG